MYYALIDMRSSCVAMTALAWGTLQEISDTLIAECQQLMENTDDMSMEELEDEYYCEFDDYKELEDCDNPTASMIESFSFTLSDCTIDVGCVVEGYSALVRAWNKYKSDKLTLDCWKLIPAIEETDENLFRLDLELRSLNDDLARDDYEFFVEAENEEDED